ncbi:centrosomal protein CCDC61 isoform X2 [Cynoglossus semilaevis]|uniref:Centrosomal protein CCDC61 n=1 Tax=Cynoglossus semilaevis TaxID=244447 RepID=A0A3P8W3S2_CYNSE|nr:coiled-coil domain-containing protein 61 isoform X2 [Cynoglossus semilaevis]
MKKDFKLMEDIVFRGVEYSVKYAVDNNLLTVEIEDLKTADQWRGEFEPACIEDLTRKTGNFKQFSVFCSMLESAVKNKSDSVELDLLTFADLELLRNRKTGMVNHPRNKKQSSVLTAKRYLILIYTVEFDRIHYPLPLPYVGKPNPAALQKEIRALRAEISALTSNGDNRCALEIIQQLQAELVMVKEENNEMTKVLEQLRMRANVSPFGVDDWRVRDVVRALEEQLVKERAESHQTARKRFQEQRILTEQVEELRASERELRLRIKNLSSELISLRRSEATQGSYLRGEKYRSLSRERKSSCGTVRSSSGSREQIHREFQQSNDRGRRSGSSRPSSQISRRSLSPAGSRVPHFDPTAYVQERQRKQQQAKLKKQRKVHRDMMSSPVISERGRSSSREPRPLLERPGSRRSLSGGRQRSRNSSESSFVESQEMTKALLSGLKQMYTDNKPNTTRGGRLTRKPLCSTPTQRRRGRESAINKGVELSRIDARLQALQNYMRDLHTEQ